MDFMVRLLIALGGVIAAIQYGLRVGAWWGRYTRPEKANRIGWGVILLGLVEGAIEGVLTHLPVGPRNFIILIGLVLVVVGYFGMQRWRGHGDKPGHKPHGHGHGHSHLL